MTPSYAYVACFKNELPQASVDSIRREFNAEVETIKTGVSDRWLIKVPSEHYAKMIAFLKPQSQSRVKQFCMTMLLNLTHLDFEFFSSEYTAQLMALV